jgi:hypothetical protein
MGITDLSKRTCSTDIIGHPYNTSIFEAAKSLVRTFREFGCDEVLKNTRIKVMILVGKQGGPSKAEVLDCVLSELIFDIPFLVVDILDETRKLIQADLYTLSVRISPVENDSSTILSNVWLHLNDQSPSDIVRKFGEPVINSELIKDSLTVQRVTLADGPESKRSVLPPK